LARETHRVLDPAHVLWGAAKFRRHRRLVNTKLLTGGHNDAVRA
jgi:hypothetical protein